ncbi:MAG: hypothetical protein ABJB12_20505 [Pseudomonadota bacterium]
MNHRSEKSAPPGALGILLVFTACGVAASRAPLGGSYAVADDTTPRDRTAPSASPVLAADARPAPTARRASAVKSPAPSGEAPRAPAVSNANVLHYDPLRVGDKVKIEASASFELALQAGHQDASAGDGKLGIDAKYRFDLEVTQASAQTLDELEVTVTPLAMRSHYGKRTSEAPLDSAETFRVTLGRSPTVRESSGSSSDEQGRAALLLLCTTLADFHQHWASSPNLELKSGWSNKSSISVPPVFNGDGAVLQLGPVLAKYASLDASTDGVPFEITLPVSYAGGLGKLDFDLKGVARLSRSQARPIAVDLSGPANGGGGPHGELNAHGFSKINATFSYR